MDDKTRDAIRKSNATRNRKCGQCGSMGTEVVDGSKIGGMPGLNYRHCAGCNWSRAITPSRAKRTKLEGRS